MIIVKAYDFIKEHYKKNGWKFQENDINIFGIRDESNHDKDIWNDFICIAHDGIVHAWKGTTDPGKWYTKNHKTGASHLCYGLHKKIWMVGTHGKRRPQSPALICHWRCKKAKMWYDKNRDGKNNENEFGYEWAINCHTTLRDNPMHIGKASAGCQVLQNHDEFFNEFMSNVLLSKKYHRNKKYKFSYALLNENQVPENVIEQLKRL